jgi:molybdopterin-guanine dinucleotide biosynthesis protein A/rhodanese-related sulfurtransferase
MGRDKSLLPVGGVPLARRVSDALRQAGADPVVAVGGDLAGLRAAGLVAVADPRQGAGPLAGLRTALDVGDVVAVLACDLVDVSPDGIRAVAAARGEADVAVPVVDGQIEPLHAVWRAATCGPVLDRLLADGERAVRAAFEVLQVAWVEGLDPAWFRNVNAPADLGETVAMTDVPEIDIDEAVRRHAEGAYVLDVRQPDEYVAGHVPGAVLVPLDQLPARQDEVPKDRPLLVICAGGGRSARAAEALNAVGYDATNIAGGTGAWVRAGHPVVEGSEPE